MLIASNTIELLMPSFEKNKLESFDQEVIFNRQWTVFIIYKILIFFFNAKNIQFLIPKREILLVSKRIENPIAPITHRQIYLRRVHSRRSSW